MEPRLMAALYKMIGGDGREYGPASLEEMRQWCEEGRIGPQTLVWRSDDLQWQAAGDRDELKWDLPTPVDETPMSVPPPIPDRVPTLTAGATADAGWPAGFGIRLSAYAIDWVILAAIATLVTLPWAEELTRLQDAALKQLDAMKQPGATPDWPVILRFWLTSLAINLPLGFAYATWFNGRTGATPGKQLLGLRILREDGSPLGYSRAFVRHAAELLSALLVGVGYLMVLVHPQRRALHDLLARTQVVRYR